jgi:hypothetical protein
MLSSSSTAASKRMTRVCSSVAHHAARNSELARSRRYAGVSVSRRMRIDLIGGSSSSGCRCQTGILLLKSRHGSSWPRRARLPRRSGPPAKRRAPPRCFFSSRPAPPATTSVEAWQPITCSSSFEGRRFAAPRLGREAASFESGASSHSAAPLPPLRRAGHDEAIQQRGAQRPASATSVAAR